MYRDLYAKTSIERVDDSYWRESLGLYNGLSEIEREVFFKVIKQIQIDTVST